MEIRSPLLPCLLLVSTFCFLVESDTLQTNFAQFSADGSMGPFGDIGDNESNRSMIVNAKSAATSTGTCASLMYGNTLIVSINLCGNKTHNCPYLSSGGSFTAWIDVTLEQTLQVWLISGSYPQAQRPLKPLIEYPNFTLPTGTGDNVSLFFRGSSCKNQTRTQETSSWNSNVTGAIFGVIPFSRNDTHYWNEPGIGAGGVGGMLAAFSMLGFLSFFLSKKHTSTPVNDCLGRCVFSYKELCVATKGFSKRELLGSGRFGTVYIGCLEGYNDALVAVKLINYNSKHAHSTFLEEISCLSKIQHPNVVQLLGWCHEKGHSMLLVYEYMPNGSLNEWLHGSGSNNKCKVTLPWKLRHTILDGVARAINYLHTDCPQCILHRNIKSSNVMLDANFVAHLGDFGLARLLDNKKQYKTSIAAGYLEYMAPEMPYIGKATKESDVYSFGILVLEVICGRRPLDAKAIEAEELVLLYSVWQAQENGTLLNIADPRLFQTSPPSNVEFKNGTTPSNVEFKNGTRYQLSLDPSKSCKFKENNISRIMLNVEDEPIEIKKIMIKNLLHLGLLCCLPNPKARPTMEQVIQTLEQISHINNVDYIIRILRENLHQQVWTPLQTFKWALGWCMQPF